MTGEKDARATLEAERIRLQAEINAYPAPITACDVYFNSLLERRSRISEQLTKLDSEASAAAC